MEVSEFLETLKKDVEKADKDLAILDAEINKAKAIGLDTRELDVRFTDLKKQTELIRKVYKI